MTDPQEMIQWLDRRIASAMTWLDDHGKGSKRPRPQHEIETKEYDIARLEEIKAAYATALAKREQAV
ncbi:hypothetical protein ELH48_09180 [Rhizobium ruizarguesonis]|uniref:hypothetical protein n=1 Tax=Rhizobium ruizarguesonis TaxID=2081791 RepID=UPI00103005A0|nr:hypothetical protein [Rhizobium ruizarguesonis]TBB27311.1 hypothetical protein ELH48_09180 [Rhizobium ruizarguesonis]